MTKAYADIRSRFSTQLRTLSDNAKQSAQALLAGEQPKQLVPDKNGWQGNPFDLEGISKAFERQEHNEDVTSAVSNPKQPGTVGDLTISAMQGDWLAAQERSFRLLKASKIRRTAHANARKYGHGHDGGVLQRGVLNDMQQILEKSKEILS